MTTANGNKIMLTTKGVRVQRGQGVDFARQRFLDALLVLDAEALSTLPELQPWADTIGGWTGRTIAPDGRLEVRDDVGVTVKGPAWRRYPEHFTWLAQITLRRANYVEIATGANTTKETVWMACRRLATFIELPTHLFTDNP